MKRILVALYLCVVAQALSITELSAAVDSGYENSKGTCTLCPQVGQRTDSWGFYTCNCTSYAAYRMNVAFGKKFSIYHAFRNDYIFSSLEPAELAALESKVDLNYLHPASHNRWSNAGRWGHIARALGIPVYDEPRKGTIAWWDANSAMPVGHVAILAEIGENPETHKPGVRFEEYNYSSDLSFSSNRWVDISDTSKLPDGYIDFVAYERDRIEINKMNHPELFQYDDNCRQRNPNREVEVFRTPDGGFIKNQNRANLPENRIWYYDTFFCTIALSPPISDLQYANDRLIFADGLGGGSTSNGSTGGIDLPNLRVRKIEVHDSNGNLLTEKNSYMPVGKKFQVRIWPKAEETDCINGTKSGRDTVETDLYYKISLDESLGSWVRYGRVYTKASTLTKGNSHMKTLAFTVPPEAAGKRIYFKAKVDSTGEVKETNEHDNWSDYEWYPVPGNCDLAISNVRLTGGRTTLREGNHFGIEMWVRNQGTTACPKDNQSKYFEKKPGQADFFVRTDDHTEAHLLIPGQDNYEVTLNEPFVADTPGTHQIEVCANSDNSNIDTNPANNCKTISFEVTAYRPDFVIDEVGLVGGATSINLGSAIPLYFYVKNIGNAGSPKDIRNAYYLMPPGTSQWQYVTDDGTNASQLCPNCRTMERIIKNQPIANVVGTWQAMACANYKNYTPELNVTNNCKTTSFTVKQVGPDFIVSRLGLKEGTVIKKGSHVHPYCVIKNIGNAPSPKEIRTAYYIDGDYRSDDGTKASELCVGCEQREEVVANSIKLGNKGTRTLTCCTDYQNAVTELNESNNCQSITFTVK